LDIYITSLLIKDFNFQVPLIFSSILLYTFYTKIKKKSTFLAKKYLIFVVFLLKNYGMLRNGVKMPYKRQKIFLKNEQHPKITVAKILRS